MLTKPITTNYYPNIENFLEDKKFETRILIRRLGIFLLFYW